MAASILVRIVSGISKLICLLTIVSGQNVPPFKELYFDQYVDHFNFLSFGQQTFKQRILIQGNRFFYFHALLYLYVVVKKKLTNVKLLICFVKGMHQQL